MGKTKTERKAARRERRKGAGRMAEAAVRWADKQGAALGWDGEEKASQAVGHLIELIDRATPLSGIAEMATDLALRAVLRPVFERVIRAAFKRVRAKDAAASSPEPESGK